MKLYSGNAIKYGNTAVAGSNKHMLSVVYTYVLILGHVFSYYKALFLPFGLGTLSVILLAPIALLFFLINPKRISFVGILPLLPFAVYILIRTGGFPEQLLLYAVAFLVVFGAAFGALDESLARRLIECISVIAAILVVLQTVIHYILGINVRSFIIFDFCLDEMMEYSKSTAGLFRPCAFFLEPSHLTQFCIFGLISSLFSENIRPNYYRRPLSISAGIVLTTSGMGIVTVFAAWAAFFAFGRGRERIGKKVKRIIIGLLASMVLFVVLYQIPFFSSAIARITGSYDGYNAIWGRTLFWDRYISTLSGTELLIGKGYSNLPEDYFTGLMVLIYAYGLIGVALLLLAIIRQMKVQNMFVKISAVCYLGLLAFGNLTGFLSIAFYFSLFYVYGAPVKKDC